MSATPPPRNYPPFAAPAAVVGSAQPLRWFPTFAVPPFAYDVPTRESGCLYGDGEMGSHSLYLIRLGELTKTQHPPQGAGPPASPPERAAAITGGLVVALREAIRLMEWLTRRSAATRCSPHTWRLRTQFLERLPQSPYSALAGELSQSYWVLGALYNWLLEALSAAAYATFAQDNGSVGSAMTAMLKVLDWLVLPPPPASSGDHRRIFRATYTLLNETHTTLGAEASAAGYRMYCSTPPHPTYTTLPCPCHARGARRTATSDREPAGGLQDCVKSGMRRNSPWTARG